MRLGDRILMSRINCLTSSGTFGRPPRGRDFHRQYKRKPARSQRITVSGLTIAKALSTSGAKPYSPTNTIRSMLPRIGRLSDLRRRILSWCRSARISISRRSSRSEQSNQPAPNQFAELDHSAEVSPDSRLFTSRIRFATGTGKLIPAFLSHPALGSPDDFCEDLRFIPLDAMCDLTAARTTVDCSNTPS